MRWSAGLSLRWGLCWSIRGWRSPRARGRYGLRPLAEGQRSHPRPLSLGERGEGVAVSFVGAGNYSTSVLIPAFKAAGAQLRSVASSAGVSGVHAGRKYGFEETTTDTDRLISDGETNAVVITIPARQSRAVRAPGAAAGGKHVFVEKPSLSDLG